MSLEEFTPRERKLFRKLLFMDESMFQAATKEQIAKQLDGTYTNDTTRQFIEKMIHLSCLTFVEERPVKIGNSMTLRPIYTRDREQMKKVYKRTEWHEIAELILDEENLIITGMRNPLRRAK